MSTITYPNAQSPAPHTFTVECPDGWSSRPVPRALLLLTEDATITETCDDDFHPNMVISHSRVPRRISLQDVGVSTLVAASKLGDDAHLEVGKVGRLDGRTVYIQTLALTVDRTGQRVAQVHVIFYGPDDADRDARGDADSDAIADLYTLVGTCLDADSAQYAPVFIEIVRSLTFGDRLVTAP